MKAEFAMKRVVYEMPGMRDGTVLRGVEYNAALSPALSLDLYYPTGSEARRPVVMIVLGYPDVGVTSPFGCQFREMRHVRVVGRAVCRLWNHRRSVRS